MYMYILIDTSCYAVLCYCYRPNLNIHMRVGGSVYMYMCLA